MVNRRNLLVGSAAALGTLGMGSPAAASAAGRNQRLTLATALPAGAEAGFRLPGGLTCPVPFMSRAAWGADESWRFTNGVEDWPVEHHPAQALTVHHTGFAASADPADTVRTIYRQQALTPARGGIQGWGDIGYNLLIDAAGVVYEGRYSGSSYPVFGPTDRLMTTGAHVLNYNTGNIGVCLLGYLNDVPATQAAQDSLVTVLAYLAADVGVNPLGTVYYYNPVAKPDGTHATATVVGVSGHRNWAATDCPGNAFYPLLPQIRQRVAAAMPAAPQPEPSPSQPSGQPTPSASPEPGGSGAPTPSTSPSAPQPGGTTQPAPPAPNPPPASTGTSHSERGGDEYVAAARSASPKEFPTVAPTATPTPTPEPSTSAVPKAAPIPTLTDLPVVRAATGVNSPDWGVTGTVAGLAVAGVLGSWWLRNRRLAASGSMPRTSELSTVDDLTPGPPTSDKPEAAPSTVDGPTADPSTVDESTTGSSTVDKPTE